MSSNVKGAPAAVCDPAFSVCDDLRAGLGEQSEVVAVMGRGYGPNTAAAIANAADLYVRAGEEGLPMN